MAKYSTLEQDDLTKLQAHGVIAIANELAEKNRLKRLELKDSKNMSYASTETHKLIQEDRA